jgi:hypothetical protein
LDFFQFVALFRDIVIILLGLVWVVAGILVAIIAFVAWRFIRTLPTRADTVSTPVVRLFGQAREAVSTAGDGARTAREAVVFVSDKAVVPAIVMASAVAGVRRFVQVLFQGPLSDQSEDVA